MWHNLVAIIINLDSCCSSVSFSRIYSDVPLTSLRSHGNIIWGGGGGKEAFSGPEETYQLTRTTGTRDILRRSVTDFMMVWYLGVSEDDEYQKNPTVEAIKRVTYFALTELGLEIFHHRFAKERQGWIGWRCVHAV